MKLSLPWKAMFSAPGSLMVLAFATSAMAGSGKFTTTQLPYWNVGQYNGALSDACQRNIFNQKKIQTLNIGYLGKKGMGVTGIATREWNLNDPTGLAKPNITYHFYNDRYSNCKVYIAHVRPRRQ
ncbi:MAG: hypothetical protein H8E36_13440 [Rhodospirillaceae bacterium]|nr:hypothetical protein [Rhodospirillaceae bacterium]